MARQRRRAWFRASLLAVEDYWSGGPGLPHPFVRLGLFTRLVPPAAADAGGFSPTTVPTLVTLELPYSVIPQSIQQQYNLAPAPAPQGWQGRPVPRWRGVMCQVGTATVWVRNRLSPTDLAAFPFVALFPQSEPAGPRPTSLLLGQQFFLQYGWQVVYDHAAIQYTLNPITQRREIAPGCVCGRLELF
jgi:hypothetical protein